MRPVAIAVVVMVMVVSRHGRLVMEAPLPWKTRKYIRNE